MRNIIAMCGAAIVAAGAPAGLLLGQEAQTVRRVYFAGPGVTIESQLIPTDQVVVVQKIESPPMTVIRERATASSELRRFQARAEAIFLGEVSSIVSELTADRSWVRTKVSIRVIETFKDAGSFGVVGHDAVIEYDGGEVLIKNVTVRAGSYPLLRVGSRGLFFASKNPEQGHWYSSPILVVTQDGKVMVPDLSEGGGSNRPIDGTPLNDVLLLLRGRHR